MLKIQFKDRRQPAVWLVESVLSMGSGGKNNLIIDDDSVSDVHAEIRKDGDHLYLADLRSFTGTQVNGKRITERFQLRAGDRIMLGKVELEIIDPKSGSAPAPVAPVVKSEWSLTALGGELKGKSFPIHGSVTLGRSNKCDININDEYMSRRHAELSLKGGALRIVDLDSSNGTYVNGQKAAEKILKPGDKIAFDQNIFLVVGPSNIKVVADDDDGDEATVFRAAPSLAPAAVPVAAPEPPKVRIPAAEKLRESLAQAESPASVTPPKSSNTSLIVVIAVSLVAMAAMAYMALK